MKKLLYLLTLSFMFCSALFSQFVPTSGPNGAGAIYCLHVSGNNLYAGTQNGGVFKTTNDGDTWTQITNGMGNLQINCLTSLNNTILAGTYSGLYRTTDGGSNWSTVNYGQASFVTALKVNGTDFYLGTQEGKLYKSTTNGASWSVFANEIIGQVTSILFHNGYIYAASSGNGVYVSTNNGANWSFQNVGYMISVLYPTGDVIRLGTGNGGKKNTTPMGGWVVDIPWINYVRGYASVGNYIIAGMSTGMFWSSNNGATWNDPVAGYLFGPYVFSMTQNSQYIFAGTSTVYRRPTSQFTGLNITGVNIPDVYSLSQNYPNPFNPGTNIKFGIPGESSVSLKVYNQVGQEISELVNQNLAAGEYEYYYDASGLSSGIYYYKLIAGDYSETKKMILIK